jgi:hypothetical protein
MICYGNKLQVQNNSGEQYFTNFFVQHILCCLNYIIYIPYYIGTLPFLEKIEQI